MARYSAAVIPLLFDVTNSTYLGGYGLGGYLAFGYLMSESNYASCQHYSCTYRNLTTGNLTSGDVTTFVGGATWYLNGTAKSSHQYELILWIPVSLGVECTRYSHRVSHARVDMASGGNSFRLVSVKVV